MIFYLSSAPTLPMPATFPFFDKVAHFLFFGGLGAIVAMGLRKAPREYSGAARVIVPIVFCLLYGLSDEIHQLFVPERMFDFADVAADVLGATVSAGLILRIFRGQGPTAEK
jgi:VanZ family protein